MLWSENNLGELVLPFHGVGDQNEVARLGGKYLFYPQSYVSGSLVLGKCEPLGSSACWVGKVGGHRLPPVFGVLT